MCGVGNVFQLYSKLLNSYKCIDASEIMILECQLPCFDLELESFLNLQTMSSFIFQLYIQCNLFWLSGHTVVQKILGQKLSR